MKEQSWIEEGWFFHNHAWHLLHEIIKQIPKDTESLLDVGAGTGIAAAIIKAIFPEIKNIAVTDIEKNCKTHWKKRNLKGYIINSTEDILTTNYDVIISSHVIEHLDYPSNHELIERMFNIANNRIIIAVPDGDVHFYDHKTIFNRTVFNDMIDEALKGCDYNKISYPVYHHHMNNLIAVIDKK